MTQNVTQLQLKTLLDSSITVEKKILPTFVFIGIVHEISGRTYYERVIIYIKKMHINIEGSRNH